MDIPEFKAFSEKNNADPNSNKGLSKQTQPAVFEGIDLEIPKFLFFKDSKDFTIPFKVDADGLAGWLKSLHHGSESYFSCQQVYRVIRELNAKDIQPQLRFTLLDFIGVALTPIVKHLEQPVLETKIPLTVTEQAHQELITAVYALLAHGFSRVTGDVLALPKENRSATLLANAVFSGLEALRKVLLHSCEAYEQLNRGYWSSCYRFYRCAERYGLLDFKIRRDAAGDLGSLGHNVDGCFKSLLLFYLSGPNQCKPKGIKALFNTLGSCAAHAEIFKTVDAQKVDRFFSFSLDRDAPPVCLKEFDEQDKQMRYLDTVKIAKIAYDALNKEGDIPSDLYGLKRPKLVQLVKNLGMGSHRKFIRAPVEKNYSGIIGYEKILLFLRNPGGGGNRHAVEPMDPRMGGNLKIPDFELVPLVEDDSVAGYSGWQKIVDDRSDDELGRSLWMQGDDGQDGDLEQFEIVNSNIKGYGMLFKERSAKVAVGEFVGIFIEDDSAPGRCEIGIVRRISQVGRGAFSLGVELIASTAEAVCVYRAGNVLTKSWALLLRGIKAVHQPDGIIYNSHLFNVGDNICLEQDNKIGYCRIDKLLYATSTLTHAELLVQR